MTVLSSGAVGIGTTSPEARLHVLDSTNGGTIQLGSTTVDAGTSTINLYGQQNYINFRHRNVGTTTSQIFGGPAAFGTDSSGYLTFSTSTTGGSLTERMRILASGNVGIGTSSPGSPLTVSTTGVNSTVQINSTDGAGGYGAVLSLNNTGTGGREYYITSTSNADGGVGGGKLKFYDVTTNTTRMLIDASGNLGLGVTPQTWSSSFKPAFQFGTTGSLLNGSGYTMLSNNWYQDATGTDKYIASNYATNYYQNAGSHVWRTAGSGTAGNTISFTQTMTLNASGNLLVGTTSQLGTGKVAMVQTAGGQVLWLRNENASAPYGIVVEYTGASPNSTTSQYIYCNDTTALRMELRSNGGIANFSANNVNLSDRREKTNFAPAKSYLDVICAIPVQTFNYIDQNLEEDDGLTLGVTAQDVQAVAPELVMESNWANRDQAPKMRLSIYQTDLQYALMKCIQEQQALIESLTARLTAVENK
jgi:hypothetical protein